jgi:PIN domain nuclease of toxin-antitoxin system
MKLLLDTPILLWWLADDSRLPSSGRQLLTDPDNEVHVSVVSLWEIAIKTSKGKLRANLHEVSSQIEVDGFIVLPIAAYHVLTFSQLPRYHGDPFDRMLVAQVLSEPMRLLTHDTTLLSYSELVMLV